MAVSCPRCGGLNSEELFYCGHCPGKLSAVPLGDVFRDAYRVQELVGEDAVSISFRAQDVKTGSAVRLREMLPRTLEPALARLVAGRFRRDTEPLPKLSFDGGARVLRCFMHERRYYAVEEWIEGIASLEELRRAQGTPDEATLREFLEEMLELLERLRALQPPLVHGEIRAANLVRRRDTRRLALIEWAWIKDLTQATYIHNETVTLHTEHISAWAPPERSRFGLTPASDVYGAAAACLELRSGRPCEQLYDTGQMDWRWEQLGLSGPLETVLRWMLAPDPDKRPQTPEQVRSLLALLDGAEQKREAGRAAEALGDYQRVELQIRTPWLQARIGELIRLLEPAPAAVRSAAAGAAAQPAAVTSPPSPPAAAPAPPTPKPTPPPPPAPKQPPKTAPAAVPPAPPPAKVGTPRPPPAPTVAPVPTPAARPGAVAARSRRALLVWGGVAATAVVVGIYLVVAWNAPVRRIQAAIGSGSLVTPVGASAYDLFFQARQAGRLSTAEVRDIAATALPRIDTAGDRILQDFHNTSRVSEHDWDSLKRLYSWASQLRGGNTRDRARLAYAEGQLLMSRSQWTRAQSFFQEAANQESCWDLAHNGLGRALVRQNRPKEAIPQYHRAAECSSTWVYPRQNLCAAYFQLGNLAAAAQQCAAAISLDPGRPGPYYYMGLIKHQQKQYCQAIAYYEKALKWNDPANPVFNAEKLLKTVASLKLKCKS